jgi:hypothetical protein
MNISPSHGPSPKSPESECGDPAGRAADPSGRLIASPLAERSALCPQTVFETTSMRLDDLLHHIAQGLLALPSFARPFLWGARETACLLDSLFNGYPAGVLIFWEYRPPAMYRSLGQSFYRRPPALLLADGRQRLTALYRALRGAAPDAEGQAAGRVRVAFSPLSAAFTPAGTKTRDNPEFIPDIAGLWKTPSSSRKIAEEYLARLGKTRRLDEDGLERVCLNIDRLLDMLHYCFPVLELPSRLGESEARDIFSRVNQAARPDARGGRRALAAGVSDKQGKPGKRRYGEIPRLIIKNSAPAVSAVASPELAALALADLRSNDAGTAQPAPLRQTQPAMEAPLFPARSFVAL